MIDITKISCFQTNQFSTPQTLADTCSLFCSCHDASWDNSTCVYPACSDECSLGFKYLVDDYWWCLTNECLSDVYHNEALQLEVNMQASLANMQSQLYLNNGNMYNKNKRTSLPDIDNNLVKLLHFIERGNQVNFERCSKSARGLFHGRSKRRSQYIGVLKNGVKCQVLLNEGKTKKYIGTYPSEVEAAIVHDFYAIGINGLSAKTNFDYNERQVAAMIQSYFEANKSFEPSIFASYIY